MGTEELNISYFCRGFCLSLKQFYFFNKARFVLSQENNQTYKTFYGKKNSSQTVFAFKYSLSRRNTYTLILKFVTITLVLGFTYT